jgi:hypothetical protein
VTRETRIATADDALAVLARAGAMTIVPTGRVPSLIGGIVGGPVRGSWWSHPEGKRIFRIATALEESGRALSAKLIAGAKPRSAKVITLLDRALWPALYRVVTDRRWRAPRIAALAPAPRALLDAVEDAGLLHRKTDAAARRALEDALLVYAHSEHTERGHHETVLSSWRRWCPPEIAAAAKRLSRADAEAALGAALGGPLA